MSIGSNLSSHSMPPAFGAPNAYPGFSTDPGITLPPPPQNPYAAAGSGAGPAFSLPEPSVGGDMGGGAPGGGPNMDDLEARLAALKKF